MQATPYFVATTILTAATALVYGYVGYRLLGRRVDGAHSLAAKLFATWWILLAGLQALGLVQRTLSAFDVRDLALWLTIMELQFLVLCVALWALLYYLVYVLTGSRKAMVPIAVFYGAFFVWILFLLASLRPVGLKESPTGGLMLDTAEQATSGTLATFIAILIGPVLIGAAGYFVLFFRVKEATQRYRIGLIALTLLTWFGSSAVASVAGLSREPWWAPTSSLLGLLAAVSIYFAYNPPRPLRRRFGLRAVGDEAG